MEARTKMTAFDFSLIIPTYNRPEALANCLHACSQLAYSQERLEVIVVDDGGKRPLTPIIEPHKRDLSIQLISQPNQGPAAARNAGAKVANGRYLAFTDDDCLPEANWLAALAVQFEQTPDALLGGCTLNALTQNYFSEASQLLVDYLYTTFAGTVNAFFTSNNMAMAKLLFDECGGFCSEMMLAAGEDREFCHRWQQAGQQMLFVPQAVVYHAHWLTAVSFWRQHVTYGRGAWHYHQLRAQQEQSAIKVEPVSFYHRLISYPYQQQTGMRGIIGCILLTLSQVANAAGFFSEKRRF
jgi:GT2 family glycosyltransferase